MSLRVKHVMQEDVATVSPSASLFLADGLMIAGDHRHLPVVSGAVLVGILTRGDILRAQGRLAPAPKSAVDMRKALMALRVEHAMTTSLVTTRPEASVNEACEQLFKHRVECLPVTEDGRLSGLFTTSGLLRAIAAPTGGMAEPRVKGSTARTQAAPSQHGVEA